MKTYYVRFGSGDPRTYTSLTPTFLIFSQNGTPVTPPSISEITASSGIYSFSYGTTTPIAFLVDGFTTSLGTGRYVTGAIDPADRADEYGNTLVAFGTSLTATGVSLTAIGTSHIAQGNTSIALGTTNVALGTTILATVSGSSSPVAALIGSVGSTFGGSSTDPIDLFGYLKRVQELLEGDNSYIKSTGVMSMFNRGSSTLLRTKTIANSVSLVTKT